MLTEIGARYGKSSAQVALRFLIQSDVVVIPKSTHKERMKQNLEVFDFTLREEDMEAIRQLDELIVAPLVAWLKEQHMDFRLLLLSDHKTLMSTRTHDGDPVPFLIYDSTAVQNGTLGYTEKNGEKGVFVEDGVELMDLLFEKASPV